MEKTSQVKWYQFLKPKKITVPRIAVLGMLLALMIALQYALSFVPGIEVISFLFIFLGIFLPFVDLLFLIASFNILILVIHGFGSWWFAYWIIWPIDALVSKTISKFTKNKFVFGLWGFIAGFSVLFWYFISDWLFFDYSYATMNTISALPINLVEGMTTMLACITIAPPMAKVFHSYSLRIWGKENPWDFKKIKYEKLNYALTIFLAVAFIAGIVLLFIYNDAFMNLKQSLVNYGGDKGHI